MLLFATMEHADTLKVLFEIFENNLINWLLLVGVIGWLGAKFLPGAFAARQSGIQSALTEASRARQEGEAFLEAQIKRISNAEKEMDNILAEAVAVANQMKEQMEQQTQKEIADLRLRIEQEIANERQLAISQLRTAAAKASIALTEAAMPAAITDGVKQRLLDQFVEQLEAARS